MAKSQRHSYAPSARVNSDLTEREIRLIQLLRRMNETIQDANTAGDMLEASVGRFAGGVTVHYRKVIAERDDTLKRELERSLALIEERTKDLAKRMEDAINELVGVEDSQTLLKKLGDIVGHNMADVIREEVRGVVQGLFDKGTLTRLVRKEARDLIFELLMPTDGLVIPAEELTLYKLGTINRDETDAAVEKVKEVIADMARHERQESEDSPREKDS